MGCKFAAEPGQIESGIDLSRQVIFGNAMAEMKLVEQLRPWSLFRRPIMDRRRRDSRQHNGITLRGLSQLTFATWGNSGIEPDKGEGISSPGTYEASLMWFCNDGERQWNTMSDWTYR